MQLTHPYSRTDLFRYFDRRLEERERASLEQHIAGCKSCQDYALFLREFRDSLTELTEEEFISDEPCPDSWTLASFEAGQVDEETARHLRAHLLFCDDCSGEYYALRRARGPAWTRIILHAVKGLLECISVTGSGELLPPVPTAATLRGEPVQRAGTVHIEAAARDPETGMTTTVRLRVEASPNKPEASIFLEMQPLKRGWKASLFDAQEQEVTSVPLVQSETTIASGLPYGFYSLNIYKGESSLASFELDMRAG